MVPHEVVEERSVVGICGLSAMLTRAAQYLLDNIPRPRRCQSLLKISERALHVSIKNLTKELLLVAKSSVKARRLIRILQVRSEREAPS